MKLWYRQRQRYYLAVVALFVFYAVVSLIVTDISGSDFHRFMILNVFLALLPLFFADAALVFSASGRRGWAVVFGLLWLFFFPNVPYLISDLYKVIHYKTLPDLFGDVGRTTVLLWVRLTQVGFGILFGTIVGFTSLGHLIQRLKQRFGAVRAYSALLVVCLLSGFAVYLGRFLRLNSWDMVQPWSIVSKLARHYDGRTLPYIALMTGYTLLTYLLVCGLGRTAAPPLPDTTLTTSEE